MSRVSDLSRHAEDTEFSIFYALIFPGHTHCPLRNRTIKGALSASVPLTAQMEFLDIPESALRNRPLTGSVLGSDGIWDDFGSPSSENNFDFSCAQNIYAITGRQSSAVREQYSDYSVSTETHQIQIKAIDREIPVRNRNVLSLQNARDIYICLLNGVDDRPGASVFVGKQYGVSPKTIRDIWNR